MPKAVSRHRSSERESVPHSHNITLHRIAQTCRQFREATSHLPIARRPLDPQKTYRHHLGLCNIICSSCHALHWIQERSYKSTIDDPLFFTCCQRGHIDLASFPDAPEPLKSLLYEDTDGISIHIIYSFIDYNQLPKVFDPTFEITTMRSLSLLSAPTSIIRYMVLPVYIHFAFTVNSFTGSALSFQSPMTNSRAFLRFIFMIRMHNVRQRSECRIIMGSSICLQSYSYNICCCFVTLTSIFS